MSEAETEYKFTNNLAGETSPYLLQHAHNPGEWYPWSEEALSRAMDEDKPILLSVGYSACHWCHVMEHESFENESIAKLMNEHFINIKVDREERPDLDNIYQSVVQLLGQGGGWPLTIFLTPEQEPFYGGTYFPPDNRYGRPGFPSVLLSVSQFYREDRDKVAEGIEKIKEALVELNATPKAKEQELLPELVERAGEQLAGFFDRTHGGFGSQPKFPNTANLSFFFRLTRRTKNEEYAQLAVLALRKMGEGGIYDQLGGGYHRYSVDARWLVPHFEKMLYDNALITMANIEAYQQTGDEFFERLVQETLDFVLREMTDGQGGSYSTLDDDSEGEEGTFYVWKPDEVLKLLGDRDGKVVCSYYGITGGGNFENGTSVLSIAGSPQHISFDLDDVSEEDVLPIVEKSRKKLFEERKKRERPFRDEKIITSWNGMMISAFARAAMVFDEPRFEAAARKAAQFILKNLSQSSRLQRTIKDGIAKYNGFLDDYAFFIAALLDLFELTQEQEYLNQASAFAYTTLQQYWDDRHDGFFFTPRDHERLLHRPKSAQDHSIPSGVSVNVNNFLRLFSLTERVDFREPAIKVMRIYRKEMEENPFGFTNLLSSVDAFLEGFREVVIVGDPELEETRELLRRIRKAYQPNKVHCIVQPGQALPENAPEMLKDKEQIDGKPTVYVCRNFVCSPPVTAWDDLEPLLLPAIE